VGRYTVNGMRTSGSANRAFTLLEAALVLFLIGVLSVASTAVFGGQKAESQDRRIQADLDAAIDASFGVMITDGMVSAESTRLEAEAPALTWLSSNTPSDAAGEVSIAVASKDDTVGLASGVANGVCWFVLLRFSAVANTAPRVFAVAPPGSLQSCTGAQALTLLSYVQQAYGTSSAGSSWRTPVQLGTTSRPVG
jgi:hypothetical protein